MIERVEGMDRAMTEMLGLYCESCHSTVDVEVFEIGPAEGEQQTLRLCAECRHMFADLIRGEGRQQRK